MKRTYGFTDLFFSRVPLLRPSMRSIKVGMTLVVDHSGKVFSKKKPTLKDLALNHEDVGSS